LYIFPVLPAYHFGTPSVNNKNKNKKILKKIKIRKEEKNKNVITTNKWTNVLNGTKNFPLSTNSFKSP